MSNIVKHEMNKITIPKELKNRSKMGILQAKGEMKSKNRRLYYFITPIAAAIIVFSLFNSTNFHQIIPGEPSVISTSQSNAFDTSDPRKLVGFSDNVFIGKVMKQDGEKSLSGYPETQFNVEVIENIKGELTGTVKVNQQGGYSWNKLILFDNDPLLVEGKTYLFATKYLESENWYTVVPVHGDIPISNEKEQKELVEKYQKAYTEEIPFQISE